LVEVYSEGDDFWVISESLSDIVMIEIAAVIFIDNIICANNSIEVFLEFAKVIE